VCWGRVKGEAGKRGDPSEDESVPGSR
jgi:hypothetical protein